MDEARAVIKIMKMKTRMLAWMKRERKKESKEKQNRMSTKYSWPQAA